MVFNSSLGEPNRDSILKKVLLVAIGGNGQIVTISFAYDFDTNYRTANVTLKQANVSEYGIAQYNIDQYSSTASLNNLGANVGGSGKIVQIGLATTVNGYGLSFQKIDIFAKVGKLIM